MPMEKEAFKTAFQERFTGIYGKHFTDGNLGQFYKTLASLVREEIGKKIQETKDHRSDQGKKVFYFSIEFLPGRFLLNHLYYLGIKETVEEGLSDLGLSLEEIQEQEEDPGLGNGGLGRLASALLDSLASLGICGYGCGIRYRYGLFEQKIIEGDQIEEPDNWLQEGFAWEYRRPEEAEVVKFGGNIRCDLEQDRLIFIHENYDTVRAVPYDVPILGYLNNKVNFLRLWSAESDKLSFEFHTFSRGEYGRAFQNKISAEALSMVLYPDDRSEEGKKLRLKQQYFFVSAGLQSIVRRYKQEKKKMKDFASHIAVHINDTHPALAVAELMRILIDEEAMEWEEAWSITTAAISYTNHTILPEALEKWPVEMFRTLLPRIYMLVEEINKRFCGRLLADSATTPDRLREMAIISDGSIKMANLAIVGSHSVNGVAKLHTEILKTRVMNNFSNYFPEKFNNKTNGIVHRRWLLVSNPRLSRLLTQILGPTWLEEPNELEKLVPVADDPAGLEKFSEVKKHNKLRLARLIQDKYSLRINPDSIFDIHIKRIHMYKRQLLNVFHIIDLYNRLRDNPALEIVPRTFIFGGKAAPAYYLAKRTIKLIHAVAKKINEDRFVREKIKIVFLENYNVSLAELVFPAADVSEQISTASKEASGTGNMKFMMNGAVTLGTLDGANIEIREKVGRENFIEFGINAEDVLNYYTQGGYTSWDYYRQDRRIKEICDQLQNGYFAGISFPEIYNHLLHYNDEFFVLRDFASYVEAQGRLEDKYRDPHTWAKMCLYNIAYSGFFSSDRTIKEYADSIWRINNYTQKGNGSNVLSGKSRQRVYCHAAGGRTGQSAADAD